MGSAAGSGPSDDLAAQAVEPDCSPETRPAAQPPSAPKSASQRIQPAADDADSTAQTELGMFPYELRPLDAATQQRVIADFPGYPHGLQSVLDWGFKVAGTATVADFAAHYRQQPRRGDLWVCSPPKCGSMWTQELVWLLENRLDFDGCRAMLTDRWRFDESRFAADLEQRAKIAAERPSQQPPQPPPPSPSPSDAPSRFVKSHLPLSLSPPGLLDVCKVVYVARNPKDICVSFYRHARRYKTVNFQRDLETFVEHFLAGTVVMTPVVPHMIEAWELRHHPNLCFVFYEDLKRDLRGQIRRLAEFLGHQYTDAEVDQLADYLHIDSFKKNPWRSEDFGKRAGMVNEGEGEFIRTGKTGDWKNHLSPETSARMDRWLEQQLRDTDLRFTMELSTQD